MEDALGQKVQVRYVRYFKQLADGMRSGSFDLVMARPSDYPARGVRDHGYQAVTTTLPDGHCLLVVQKDSPFQTLADLQGKRLILPEEAAYMTHFCLAELRDQGVTFDRARVNYVKEQAAIPFALGNGLVQVGGIASYSGAAKKLEANGLRVIHTSRAQPYLPLVAGKRLTAQQVQHLRDAMVALSKTEEGGKALAALGLKAFDTQPQARMLALLEWLEK
jgi:ABC-type phosphate/phosphonate transport system substrate-binding protein